MTVHKYLVLLAIVIFGATGDALLSRGMKEVGEIHLNDWHELIYAIGNPWVLGGIVLLLGFFASYLTALSWADLTYVLPATAIGYVVLALIAKFYLHEHISLMRWAGILLITAGVGFVATGPALTEREEDVAPVEKIGREA